MIFFALYLNRFHYINSEAAYRHVLDVIAYNSAEIASWLQKSHLDKMEYGETYNRLTCELNMHEKIGTVYTMNGEEYDSSGITLTLERNKTGTSPLGFSLVTAYPNIIYAEKTGNKVDLELLALSGKEFKTPEDRIAMYGRSVFGFTTQKVLHGESVRVSCVRKNESKRVDMYLSKDRKAQIKYVKIGEKPKTISWDDLEKMNPKIKSMFEDVEKVARDIYKMHSVDKDKNEILR